MSAHLTPAAGFRAIRPIKEAGIDRTLAQLRDEAAAEFTTMVADAQLLIVGAVSWRIEASRPPLTGPQQLVAECATERWVDPVRSRDRRGRHLVVAS
jgi:hypothetical protein